MTFTPGTHSRRRQLVLVFGVLAASSVILARAPQQKREPASRSAVVLTWTQAEREAGFAGMETILLTRTVRASERPRSLPDGQFIVDGARVGGTAVVTDPWLQEATRAQVATGGAGSGYGYQWWARPEGAFEGRGIYGQTLHVDPKRRLVIAINSAGEQPTGRGQGQARQDFIAAVKAEIDRER